MSLEVVLKSLIILVCLIWIGIGLLVLWAMYWVREGIKDFKTLTPAEIKEAHKIYDDD